MSTKLPSAAQIGDRVDLPATVVGVGFTEGKVHYRVKLENESEIFVDSECITTREVAVAGDSKG